MTDRNRDQNQQNRGQQQSSTESQRTAPRHQDEWTEESIGSSSPDRSTDRESADDRGPDSDRRRDFGGNREQDELERDTTENRAVEGLDTDEGPDGSER